MFRSYLLALPALLLGVVTHASPAPSLLLPRTCSPNFQGQAQTIYVRPAVTDIGVYEWTPDSIFPGAHITLQTRSVNDAFPQGEFLVQFTGQPDGSYVLRLKAETNRYTALTAGPNGDLTIDILTLSSSIPSQRFTINCNTCPSTGETVAKQCTIANPASGTCIVGSNSGDTLRLGSCSEAGVYDFQAGF
ncbi:hypothetical protein H0H87_004262 [Tephrocybe sp. NHM501043]|nr:hypothetical protein H0H87_004262 [Tephrocybe sp. NHM501043]